MTDSEGPFIEAFTCNLKIYYVMWNDLIYCMQKAIGGSRGVSVGSLESLFNETKLFHFHGELSEKSGKIDK